MYAIVKNCSVKWHIIIHSREYKSFKCIRKKFKKENVMYKSKIFFGFLYYYHSSCLDRNIKMPCVGYRKPKLNEHDGTYFNK